MRLSILLLILALPVQAGPWPKPAGEAYLSTGVSRDASGSWASLYGEVGLGRDLTLAFALGGRPRAAEAGDRQVEAMLWHPLPDLEDWRLGAAAGVQADLGGAARPQVALAAGRGLETRFGGGWVVAEIAHAPGRRTRLAATLGVKPTDRDALDLRLSLGREEDETTWTLAPSWERTITDRLALRTGLTLGADGPGGALALVARF